MSQVIQRTYEFKLYPSASQIATLESWLRTCCWVYNQALEHRKKVYRRRRKSIMLYDQYKLLTEWRSRIAQLRSTPVELLRSALRRIDRGMKAFFHRVKAKQKPGFPRFKSHRRYDSMECLERNNYFRGHRIFVPKLGLIRARGQFDFTAKQKALRILRRAAGWYAQIVVEQSKPARSSPTGHQCGLDLGLTYYATLDSGEQIENLRPLRKASKKLRRAQKKLSRCRRGSANRKRAVRRVAKLHEKVARKRLGFCHRLSRNLVNRFDRIAVEKLNVLGLSRGKLRKSVGDAAWGTFLQRLRYKAESAGRVLVEVDPRGTSQECPHCGAVKAKTLSERVHQCPCGLVIDRDQAAAMVIRRRAFGPGGVSPGQTPSLVGGARTVIPEISNGDTL